MYRHVAHRAHPTWLESSRGLLTCFSRLTAAFAFSLVGRSALQIEFVGPFSTSESPSSVLWDELTPSLSHQAYRLRPSVWSVLEVCVPEHPDHPARSFFGFQLCTTSRLKLHSTLPECSPLPLWAHAGSVDCHWIWCFARRVRQPNRAEFI